MRASAMEGRYGVRILQYRYVLRMETAGEQCAGMSPPGRWGTMRRCRALWRLLRKPSGLDGFSYGLAVQSERDG